MQGIVHLVHNLLKAFLVLAGWKGWRREGQKGGYQSHRAQQAELASCQQLQGHTDLPKMGSKFISAFLTGNLLARVHFQ